jgi:hypothetical protein
MGQASQVPDDTLTGSSHLPTTIRVMPKIHNLRVWFPIAGAAMALALLAGCAGGSSSSAAGQVASIPRSGSTAASAGPGTAAAANHSDIPGPTLPDDATPAQMKAIMVPWFRCLGSHGVHMTSAQNQKMPGVPYPDGTITAAVHKACASLQPHPPWQEMPQYNPDYNLDLAKWVNCMNARGMAVEATATGPTAGGWTFTRSNQPANADQIEGQCEKQAFGES